MWLYFVAVFFVCVFSEGEFALWIMFVRIDIDFFSLKKKSKKNSLPSYWAQPSSDCRNLYPIYLKVEFFCDREKEGFQIFGQRNSFH